MNFSRFTFWFVAGLLLVGTLFVMKREMVEDKYRFAVKGTIWENQVEGVLKAIEGIYEPEREVVVKMVFSSSKKASVTTGYTVDPNDAGRIINLEKEGGQWRVVTTGMWMSKVSRPCFASRGV